MICFLVVCTVLNFEGFGGVGSQWTDFFAGGGGGREKGSAMVRGLDGGGGIGKLSMICL